MKQTTSWRQNRMVRVTVLPVVAALLAAGAWQLFFTKSKPCVVSAEFKNVMGVRAQLVAVVPPGEESLADQAIQAAIGEISRVDRLMSSDKPQSEIAVFNSAPAGKVVKLSPATLAVLRLSRQYAAKTGGAFDVTCRSLLMLWKKARDENRMPTDQEIADARAKVGWDKVELLEDGASKKVDGLTIELAGIVGPYAMDQAAQAMRTCGLTGGMVNLGDDYIVFGRHGKGDLWLIPIRNPFGGEKPLASLLVRDAAVCTRSNYEKSYLLGGKRISCIVDSRTGAPAELAPSVTVVGVVSEKAILGAWATALSVSGPDGLKKMPPQAPDAMMVTGDKDNYHIISSPGFDKLLESPLAEKSAASAPARREVK